MTTSVCCCPCNQRSGSGSHHATRLGWCGVEIGVRVSPEYWTSWADSLAVIHRNHPGVANRLVMELEGLPTAPFLRAAADAKKSLIGTMRFDLPSGRRRRLECVHSLEIQRTSSHGPFARVGSVEQHFREVVFMRVLEQVQALVGSQAGPGRVVLCRLLRQHLFLFVCNCRCGPILDVCGHHRAACAWCRRGCALEGAVARMC